MTYEERQAQRESVNRMLLATARDNGFINCHEVFDALGFERINAGGMIRSSLQVSARWIREAGFRLEQIVPDGYSDIPKAERCGCHADDLPEIVAYKDAYYGNTEDPDSILMVSFARRAEIEQAERDADKARDGRLIAGFGAYAGPLNRKGLPKRNPLAAHMTEYNVGDISRAEVRTLWPKRKTE